MHHILVQFKTAKYHILFKISSLNPSRFWPASSFFSAGGGSLFLNGTRPAFVPLEKSCQRFVKAVWKLCESRVKDMWKWWKECVVWLLLCVWNLCKSCAKFTWKLEKSYVQFNAFASYKALKYFAFCGVTLWKSVHNGGRSLFFCWFSPLGTRWAPGQL